MIILENINLFSEEYYNILRINQLRTNTKLSWTSYSHYFEQKNNIWFLCKNGEDILKIINNADFFKAVCIIEEEKEYFKSIAFDIYNKLKK